MAVGDIAKLVIQFAAGGQQFRPGLHFSSRVELQTMQSLIDAWQATCQGPMLATMSNQITLTVYEAQDRVPGVAASVEEALAPPLPGGVVDELLPPQDAVIFSLKSALKSRRARGRVYWPGATEQQHVSGQIASASLTSWQALVAAIESSFVGTTPPSGWQLVVFSPEDLTPPKAPPVFKPRPGVVVTPVMAVVLDQVIRSQRRRQLGVGQ